MAKKLKTPKRRNVYAASLADGRFKPRILKVKRRKLLEKAEKCMS